jgi:hypothetical protein
LALSSPCSPALANPAAYTKGTSHHRGGCRAPASGSTDAQHVAHDLAPLRLAVCEDGEWRERAPRLLLHRPTPAWQRGSDLPRRLLCCTWPRPSTSSTGGFRRPA